MVDTLTRGLVEFVSPGELEKKLALGRPLRVKFGVDPTTADLHLGHTVPLQKLRAFQDLGHTAVLIIGDYTARIGDPSGRDATRPQLTPEAVAANAKTYTDQAFLVLDEKRTELRWNSEWLDPFMKGDGLLKALSRATVQQILSREDFAARMGEGSPITMLELLYPLLQGFDSVAVKADVELGGNDQLFNLLMGREMQKDEGQEPQVVMTVPLLVGLDGTKKMSKSYGNAVGVREPAREIFGKIMKISDEAMLTYYELLTGSDPAAVRGNHPMEAKKKLAETLTSRFHGPEAGPAERKFFEETFSKRQAPADAAEVGVSDEGLKTPLSKYLQVIGAVGSRKEAMRLIQQGAVKIGDAKIAADGPVGEVLPDGAVLKVGKHKFYKLVRKAR